jgi:hypothetical protein
LSFRQGQPQAFAPEFGGLPHRRFTCPCEPSA